MANKEKPRDFGRYLQQCRRTKGISLDAISRVTRITVPCLQQIESEDLAHLPSPVYVKGFLKAYADAVGADEREVLRRYDAGRQAFMKREAKAPMRPVRPRILPRLLAALILLAILIAATLYAYKTFQVATGPEPEAPPAKTAPAEEVVPPAEDEKAPGPAENTEAAPEANAMTGKDTIETPQPVEQSTAVTPKRDTRRTDATLTLKIVAVAPTWIKIIADGQTPQELMLQTDDEMTLEAQKHFSLLIGNAGGIRLTLNGKTVPVPGESGQVVTLQLP